ncbi:hypothetical protein [Trinickia dinghuensis]|uniref:Tetratricopeptide repeat protein n=1 Tax=Trinickia dinghuensis TaxID=2291023 RepID=A0A3D8JTG0_9BURK|nr:hypothetical protein [Trinickia dinghuensis]RDU96347.1 hypothetical protein DWV00_24985 [Trinickia dinghuensis]
MRDQTAREQKFPTACARCGGRISEPVAFCPHCGAHARFALAGNAAHDNGTDHAGFSEHAGGERREPRGPAASARAEPRAPAYDFEGDLDPPWPGPPTPLFASPDGDPYPYPGGGARARAAHEGRQWGLKGGTALVVAAFVLLYGGVVVVHRYDGILPLPHENTSKSVEGSIASTGGNDSSAAAPSDGNGNAPSGSNAMQPPAPVANNVAPAAPSGDDGARLNGSSSNSSSNSNSVASNANGMGTPPARRADESTPPPGTSVASLPPPAPTMQAQPNFAMQSPQQPSAAPAPPQAQQQPNGPGNSYANGRSRGYAPRSAEGRVPGADANAAYANAKTRQQYRRSLRNDVQAESSGREAAYRSLGSAQAALSKNDLRGARASLDRVLAADPSNGEAQSLREELVSREQERDVSLSAAHACVVQSRWNCVWHNAGKALSVDASSTEAKALVDRAIVESGAATAPAGPGPDNVQVPMIQ